jgi:hypothetical protein
MRQLTVSPILCTTEIGMCHIRGTICRSLKHDLQLNALTSSKVFNHWQAQGNSITCETGTHKAVLQEALLPGARLIAYMGTVGHINSFPVAGLENISKAPSPAHLFRKCRLTVML